MNTPTRLTQRINAGLALFVALTALIVVALLASRAYGGPLDPPAPPGSTRPGIEPRVPITQPASAADFPIVINQPGSYYLASNINGVAAKHGILITSGGVTLDLNGFQMVGVPTSLDGVSIDGAATGPVNVRNGVIRDWDGAGVFGFTTVGGVFEDLSLLDNGSSGIGILAGNDITRVISRGHSAQGIQLYAMAASGGRERDSIATNNGYGLAISGDDVTVTGSIFVANTVAGVDISGVDNLIEGNYFRSNGNGVRLLGQRNAVVKNLLIQTAATAVLNQNTGNRIGSSAAIGANTVSSTDAWSNMVVVP